MPKHETVADIVAELQRCSDKWIDDKAKTTMECLGLIAIQFARRIEAAWKREKAEWEAAACAFVSDAVMSGKVAVEHAPVGNAAAMHEALVKCREIALQWQADEADGVAGTTDKPSARSAAEAVIDMEFEINAALSDPARNCDLFDNWYDAHQAWERLPKDELGYFVAANGVHECEQAWLFATAEQKGELESTRIRKIVNEMPAQEGGAK